MSSIEDRIAELTKKITVLTARFDAFENKAGDKIFSHGLRISFIEDTIEILERGMHRWNDVYRHIFPKRAAQDDEFERQLHNLKVGRPPSEPEDGNTKL